MKDRAQVIFMSGFKSDMEGTKALFLDQWAAANGRGFLRFDYSGHGQSSGDFLEGTIGDWFADSLEIIDQCTEGPLVVVGSSMGGWIALLAALARPERITGLLGIAAAPDFTEDLMWNRFSEDTRKTITTEGVYAYPSDYDDEEPYQITLKLIEEGRQNLLLDKPIPLTIPIRLIHGMKDEDVPLSTALILTEQLTSEDVTLTLLKEGDHRLSNPEQLALVRRELELLCDQVE